MPHMGDHQSSKSAKQQTGGRQIDGASMRLAALGIAPNLLFCCFAALLFP
ncbi:MAG: hypothetical protein IT436_09155 [Phycisphaerales bacterium]|nr:hypothetical protein [Phycisphaerales bacterium]